MGYALGYDILSPTIKTAIVSRNPHLIKRQINMTSERQADSNTGNVQFINWEIKAICRAMRFIGVRLAVPDVVYAGNYNLYLALCTA